ncbi:hypothetical protein D9M71_634630 [compost metagenome]
MTALSLSQIAEGPDMTCGQVADMDIVADSGPVDSGVVTAVHGQPAQSSDRHLGNVREQVVGNTVWIFADEPTLMGADWIEVPEHCNRPARVGMSQVAEHVLDHQLAPAVGAGNSTDFGIL